MKKPLLLGVLATLLLASCDKKENTIPDPSLIEDSTYIINGLSSISVSQFGSNYTPLELLYKQGKQDEVTLSVEGLPDGTEATFNPKSGVPGFNTYMKVESRLATPGEYPVTLVGTSASGTKKRYNFNVTIRNNYNCDSVMMMYVNQLYTLNHPTGDTIYSNSRVQFGFTLGEPKYFIYDLVVDTANGTVVSTQNASGGSFNAIELVVDCGKNIISMPGKTIRVYNVNLRTYVEYYIEGEGTFDHKHKQAYVTYKTVNSVTNETKYYRLYTPLRI